MGQGQVGRPIGPDNRIRAVNGSRVAQFPLVAGNGKIRPGTHGTRSCYVYWRCRCDPCRDAEADYQREAKRRQRMARAG